MVQNIIYGMWLIGMIFPAVTPMYIRMKRQFFPYTEFRVGQNEQIEERNAAYRKFIIGTLIGTMVIGLFVNYLSDFLFH